MKKRSSEENSLDPNKKLKNTIYDNCNSLGLSCNQNSACINNFIQSRRRDINNPPSIFNTITIIRTVKCIETIKMVISRDISQNRIINNFGSEEGELNNTQKDDRDNLFELIERRNQLKNKIMKIKNMKEKLIEWKNENTPLNHFSLMHISFFPYVGIKPEAMFVTFTYSTSTDKDYNPFNVVLHEISDSKLKNNNKLQYFFN
jgi:hypothetical protein